MHFNGVTLALRRSSTFDQRFCRGTFWIVNYTSFPYPKVEDRRQDAKTRDNRIVENE